MFPFGTFWEGARDFWGQFRGRSLSGQWRERLVLQRLLVCGVRSRDHLLVRSFACSLTWRRAHDTWNATHGT